MPYFPFVELRPGADVVSMVASRPILTLAVCTVAATAQPDVQSRLSEAFRYTLSSKIILSSEPSMDLFTGLLVFLAWHHHYTSTHQVYQQLALLAGMAAELGLYRAWLDPADPSSALERDRAFVGCYYICCGLSKAGFDKPSPLRWTTNLRGCAERAASVGGLASDRALISTLELMRAVDDMEDGLREASEGQQSVSITLTRLHTKSASQRLKALKREHPSLSGTLGFSAATIHTFQRLLKASDTPDYPTSIQCAFAIQEYIDDLLARPPSALHQLAIVDWVNLLDILILMARVFKPLSGTAGWEAGALSPMLQPEVLLDSICSHMAAAPSHDPLLPRHEPMIQWLRGICEGIKRRILHDNGSHDPHARGEKMENDSQQLVRSENAGFQAVNEPSSHYKSGTGTLDAFNLFGNGVLDAKYLTSLTSRP